MTPFDKLLLFLTQNWQLEVRVLAKIGVLLLLSLYLVFTLVVVKQIKIMGKAVNGLLEKELLIGARVLIGLAIATIILAIIIL